MKTELTPKQKDMLNQVVATMSIEDMPPTEQCYAELKAIVTKEKTKKQVITEIIADLERNVLTL